MRLPSLPLLKILSLNKPTPKMLPPPSLVMTLLPTPEPDPCEEKKNFFFFNLILEQFNLF